MEGFRCWSEFDGICKNTHAAMPEFLKIIIIFLKK
jgi:hypothetical protein